MSALLASSVDWTNVLVALIAGLPAIIAAVAALRIHSQIRTPSGKSIGKQMEDANHTVLSNNYRLRSIGDTVKAPSSPESHAESQKVDTLMEGNGADVGLGPQPGKE